MCRWMVYFGEDAVLSDVIIKPGHSIIRMSYGEHHLPDITKNWTLSTLQNLKTVNHIVSADGFGVGWYSQNPRDDGTPVIFTSIQPPWSNRNLHRLAPHIVANCIFCHVRAASPGSVITETNCHPFQFGRYMFMHNGGVPCFSTQRLKILTRLSDRALSWIEGTTDSEHIGAFLVDQLASPDESCTHAQLRQATLATIRFTVDLVRTADCRMFTSLNFAVTDGRTLVTTRFRNQGDPPSLYYRIYRGSECFSQGEETGDTHSLCPSSTTFIRQKKPTHKVSPTNTKDGDEDEHAIRCVAISSEPLTFERGAWTLVPRNHMLIVDKVTLEVMIEPIYIGSAVDKCFQKWKATALRKTQVSPVRIAID